MNDLTTRFDASHPHNRTVSMWRRSRLSNRGTAKACAKAYARENGVALMWRSDSSGLLYYMDGGKLRQRVFPRMAPVVGTHFPSY